MTDAHPGERPVRPQSTDECHVSGLGWVAVEGILSAEGGDPQSDVTADYDGVDGEVMDLDEDSEEAAPKRSAPDPGKPTDAEREAHREDHIPYRCWCEHCVKGRGSGEPHKGACTGMVPVVAFDYLIVTKHGEVKAPGSEPYEVLLKILVVKDVMARAVFAHVVPQKGVGEDRFAVECLRRDILWLGHTKVMLKCDNEPAMRALLVEALKGIRLHVEQATEKSTPRYDSQANGSIENGIKQLQGLVRTLRSCLETRIGMKIPTTHAVRWWVIRHAAWLLTVRPRGTDGRTSYERLRGREFPKKVVGFGEVCL